MIAKSKELMDSCRDIAAEVRQVLNQREDSAAPVTADIVFEVNFGEEPDSYLPHHPVHQLIISLTNKYTK